MVRNNYSSVFPEEELKELDSDKIQSDKIYKIKYCINLLTLIGQHVGDKGEIMNRGVSFFDLCSNSDELDMFKCESIQELIDFKWNEFGFNFHLIGSLIHMVQISILIFYVNYVYIRGSLEVTADGKLVNGNPAAIILLTGIIYPLCYSVIQSMRVGTAEYFQDYGNWFDMFYILGSITMSILHLVTSPFFFVSKAVMIFVITQSIFRTFKCMRIITLYSPIVTMLQTVVYDLRIFLLFYMILVGFFSLTLGVLGNGNAHPDISPAFAEEKALAIESGEPYLGIEYLDIPRIIANFIDVLQVSTGEFKLVEGTAYLSAADTKLFWIVFLLICVLTNIIFLNFIIAEASTSYEKVSDEVESYISK
jgi:hypothetical protein